jgi:hypothetical protein
MVKLLIGMRKTDYSVILCFVPDRELRPTVDAPRMRLFSCWFCLGCLEEPWL